jgi:hypothetical protein
VLLLREARHGVGTKRGGGGWGGGRRGCRGEVVEEIYR